MYVVREGRFEQRLTDQKTKAERALRGWRRVLRAEAVTAVLQEGKAPRFWTIAVRVLKRDL